MNNNLPKPQHGRSKQRLLDKAILGIAQAYGPYQFWLENINPMANPDTTWRALMVISALRDRAFMEKVLYLLNSPDSRVRAWSCYYLAAVQCVQASDKLMVKTNDPSSRVRYHARKAFINMHPGSENVFAGNKRFMHGMFPVLISDDQSGGRQNLALMLRKQGFLTFTAAMEKETIDLALRNNPQVIVTDNQKVVPVGDQKTIDNISGLNMTWDICRLPALRETILIMLTADEIEPIFLWQGGDIFLSKMRMGGAVLRMVLQELMR